MQIIVCCTIFLDRAGQGAANGGDLGGMSEAEVEEKEGFNGGWLHLVHGIGLLGPSFPLSRRVTLAIEQPPPY